MPTQGSSSRRGGGGKDGKDGKDEENGKPSTTTPETHSLTSKLQHEVQQHVTQEQKRFIIEYKSGIASTAASFVSTLSTFPLDSVKTRMQTYQYKGVLDCMRQTYRAEKMKGFFRGVTAPLASITMVRTTSFTIYQRSKQEYSDWMKRHFAIDVMAHIHAKNTYPTLATVACFGAAGATAGSCITLIACPFEITKLSAQVSVLLADPKKCPKPEKHKIAASYQNKGTLKTMMNIIHHRGPLGLYTGFRMHLLRDSLGTAIYFMTYESTKQLLTNFGGATSSTFKSLAVLFSGGFCGVVSWVLIYPVDSAKSIYQRNCLMYSRGETVPPVKIEFFRLQMYRGLGVSMGRSCAVNAIFFSVVEFLTKRIDAWKEDQKT